MIPNHIKIDAVMYNVIESPGPLLIKGLECTGTIDYCNNLISILETLGESQKKVTLMHEIMHGIVYERTLDLNKSDEETVVNELGKGFINVIRDNPELIDYITKKE